MKRNNRGRLFVWLGVLLLIGAALWYGYNVTEDHTAGQRAEEILEQLDATTPETTPDDTITLLGEEFCGTVSVDKLGIRLPVYAEWDYQRLKTAPCRYFGSAETNDLIIAAHNYQSHFGALDRVVVEDVVRFTDASGQTHTYRVCEITTLDGTAVTDMQAGGWDLTLFTCTKGGQQRITLRCREITLQD